MKNVVVLFFIFKKVSVTSTILSGQALSCIFLPMHFFLLLAEDNLKIYEVANTVGYSSQNNFGRNFLKQFGMIPTSYQLMKHNERNTK